jgi:flagella basal body P-ring formation protein FlgA
MAAILLLAVFISGVSFGSELSVSLPSSIEARDGWFYLGEYAEIAGDRELADSASMAVIKHGGAFTRDDVVEALASTAAAGSSVALTMPDAVTVRPESSIASELRAVSSWKWRVEVEVIPGSWDELIAGYSGYAIPPKITPGVRSLAIKLEDAEGRRFNKQIKLTWYQPVVYSARALAKGDTIDAKSLRTRIGTASMMITNLSSPEQLAGAEARKPVNAMAPMETGDITHESFIRAGTTVMMVARVNGLGVEVRGVAMQRGGLGDVIRVKNLSSKKVMRARIIGADRVEIFQ